MTYQVKEGDVLEYRGDGDTLSSFPFKAGKEYTVKAYDCQLFIEAEDGGKATAVLHCPKKFGFHLVPPETIQHGGYNYTRGEPVVPEWVKDGAWVVDTVHGRVLTVRGNHEVGYSLYDQKGNLAYMEPDIGTGSTFRPFTNEDWKWGMWAEYKGEKVFVCKRLDGGVTASRPAETYFFIPFSELTPTTAP